MAFSIIISEKGGAERREAFDKNEINVGRVQGNDLMLPKGNVSKHHARLLFRDGRFIVTDLKTGRHEKHPETADGLPPGGAFTKMGAPAPYGLTISRAPHSLAEGADGKWYLTESIGGSIGAFDPVKKTYEHFDVGNGAVYPPLLVYVSRWFDRRRALRPRLASAARHR